MLETTNKLKKASLADSYPEIAKFWHPAKNGTLTPANVAANSGQRAWFKCPTGDDHEWEARVAQVVISFKKQSQSKGCPICRGLKVVLSNSLATVRLDLAKQWHPTKNGILTPYDVHWGSHTKAWWKCCVANDHEWFASIKQRAAGNGCPMCRGSKIVLSNSLAIVYPDLAKQWHSIKNGTLTPYDVHSGSHKKAWWECLINDDHEWKAAIDNRVNGSGCPFCNSGWTADKMRLFLKDLLLYLDTLDPVDLYGLFEEEGLLDSTGRCRAFVKACTTGNFPKAEIEKFVNNEPSLVDEFIQNQEMTLDDQDDELLGEMPDEDGLYSHKGLPNVQVQTKDVFALLESGLLTRGSDTEKIDYFIKKACANIWQHTYVNEQEAQAQIAQLQANNEYAKHVRELFCAEYAGAKSLKIPKGYSFPYQPNLMQRHIAYLIQTRRRIGNWSGTGTGKTLAAILASRVIKAQLTVITCPNNVIDNWKDHLIRAYPDSLIYTKEQITSLKRSKRDHQYLLLNYEFFQTKGCRVKFERLLEECQVDFFVIDEIHYAKQRNLQYASKRKKNIFDFLSLATHKNENIHVLGMSATPVINELLEGKTLIELVTGVLHEDLDTKRTVKNCIKLYKKFVTHGIRYVPEYSQAPNDDPKYLDCSTSIEQLRGYKTYIELEGMITQLKIPYILEELRPKTIVYTHYRKGIEEPLRDAISNAGWKVALFNGDTKDGLKDFIKGDVDILIASICIGTGVDGLQHVSNRLIINCLPWTHSEYKQLIGRIYRQGQKSTQVDVIIPLIFFEINGQRKSQCAYRWECIQRKKTVADAAVDGTIPEGHLKSREQLYKEFMMWVQQVCAGSVNEIERKKLMPSFDEEVQKAAMRRVSDLCQMNARINARSSTEMHQKFLEDPHQWYDYHKAYREIREEWEIVPYQEAIKWCQARPNVVIGDFGCGEAFLAQELQNKVYSFDHVAISDKVTACDMVHVPLQKAVLDAAIFSLSLMGTNWIDYLREAHRCLKLDGHIWIAEPTARFADIGLFKELLERLGFDIRSLDEKGKFTFITAIKSERAINEVMLFECIKKQIFS